MTYIILFLDCIKIGHKGLSRVHQPFRRICRPHKHTCTHGTPRWVSNPWHTVLYTGSQLSELKFRHACTSQVFMHICTVHGKSNFPAKALTCTCTCTVHVIKCLHLCLRKLRMERAIPSNMWTPRNPSPCSWQVLEEGGYTCIQTHVNHGKMYNGM